MSIDPISAAIPAGAPLAQTVGPEADRANQEVGAYSRTVYHDKKAAAAGGVGQPDGDDHETADRDADGRRQPDEPPFDAEATPPECNKPVERQSKDPSRHSGNFLDLTG